MVVMVMVVVSVFMDMATAMLLASGDTSVFGDTAVDNTGILDPLRHLAHRSVVVACPMLVPPIIVRQRDSFRFWLSYPTENGLVLTAAMTAVSPQWHGVQPGMRTGTAIMSCCDSFD